MTLEEYERQLAEKKAALNKQAQVSQVSLDDFKGMKAYERKETEEDVAGLELSNKKATKEVKAKATKQVRLVDALF